MNARRLARREHAWCLAANRWGARGAVRSWFRLVSRLGDGAFWYALMAGLVLVDGWRGRGATAHQAATRRGALILYGRLKRWTKRPRPFSADRRIRPLIAPLDEFSFPSGHTLHAVAFTVVALAHYPALAPLLLPFTASVAVSRVVLGLHYPSDVLAATGIGIALGAASLQLAALLPAPL